MNYFEDEIKKKLIENYAIKAMRFGIIIGFTLGLLISAIGLIVILVNTASAESDEKHFIKINEEAMTISHDFSMTASVSPNDCNTCLRENQPTECLVKCEQVVDYY